MLRTLKMSKVTCEMRKYRSNLDFCFINTFFYEKRESKRSSNRFLFKICSYIRNFRGLASTCASEKYVSKK